MSEADRSLRDRILNFVFERDHVSFAELVGKVEGVGGGETALCLPGFDNILVWAGLSEEGGAVLLELLDGEFLVCEPTTPLIYLADGRMLRFPIARQRRQYKSPHWVPVVLRTGWAAQVASG